MQRTSLSILLLATLLVAAGEADAQTTIFVEQATGSDTNDGLTPATAVATITRGLQLVGSAGTVMIGPGTYSPTAGEAFPCTGSGSLTLLGSGSATTILDGETTAGGLVSLSGLDLRVEGLTLQGSADTGLRVNDPLQNIWVEDVHFLGNDAVTGGAFYVNMGTVCADTTIVNCMFAGNTAISAASVLYRINPNCDATLTVIDTVFDGNVASASGAGAIQFQENGTGTHTLIIDRSTFVNNSAPIAGGIWFARNAGTAFSTITNCRFDGNDRAIRANDTFIDIVNSTFTNNGEALRASDTGSAFLANDIFWGNAIGLRGSGGTISFSIVQGLAYAGFVDLGDNLDLDPMLDISGHLTAGSPAIDQGGEAAAAMFALIYDLDLDPRVIDIPTVIDGSGGSIDIGADEHASPTCTSICGDCNLSATGPDILDALAAAQIATALVVPSLDQVLCCDVNSSGTVDVLDALGIAQEAAGLVVMLQCP